MISRDKIRLVANTIKNKTLNQQTSLTKKDVALPLGFLFLTYDRSD
jgi:hypothetical protein